MTVVSVNRSPSPRDLRWFGVMLVVFVGLVGALTWWRTGSTDVPATIWTAGGALSLVYYAWPAARRRIFIAWMYLAFPIGWVVSHTVLAAVYYLLVTPIAAVMRLIGRDPLARQFKTSADSYWERRNPGDQVDRYFKQF